MNDAVDPVLDDDVLDEIFVARVADEQRHAVRQR